MSKKAAGGGGKKIGRGNAKCQSYRLRGQRERNRKVRAARAERREAKFIAYTQRRSLRALNWVIGAV